MTTPTHFRYRRLSSDGTRQVEAHYGRGSLGVFNRLSAEAGAVRGVKSVDSEATFDALVDLLRQGQVSPSDLVFTEGRWLTLEESPEFGDVCLTVVDRRKLRDRLVYLGLAAGALLIVVGVLTLRLLA